jgi:hypothetical protein
MLAPVGKGAVLANALAVAVVVSGRATPNATEANARNGTSCWSILESLLFCFGNFFGRNTFCE